ncbi:MAG: hypothetical protein QHH07_12105 [Sedimentisphaerales bacterium]|jgi:hypothetical protein|nr:hypothetical protein [Sedimentisphaerales bacterium]
MEGNRFYLWLVVTTVGVVLLGLGLGARSVTIYERPSTSTTIATPSPPAPTKGMAVSEVRVILEVARGGLMRDDAGRLVKPYEGDKPPKACPT